MLINTFFLPDSSSPRSPRSSDGNRDDLSALIPSPSNYPKSATTIRRLRVENDRLQAEVTRLKRLVVSGATSVLSERKLSAESDDPSSKTHALEMELQLAKEALLSKYFLYIYIRIYQGKSDFLDFFYNNYLKVIFVHNFHCNQLRKT